MIRLSLLIIQSLVYYMQHACLVLRIEVFSYTELIVQWSCQIARDRLSKTWQASWSVLQRIAEVIHLQLLSCWCMFVYIAKLLYGKNQHDCQYMYRSNSRQLYVLTDDSVVMPVTLYTAQKLYTWYTILF